VWDGGGAVGVLGGLYDWVWGCSVPILASIRHAGDSVLGNSRM